MSSWLLPAVWTLVRATVAIAIAMWLGEPLATRLRWPPALGMMFVAIDSFLLLTIPELCFRIVQTVRWMQATRSDGTMTIIDLVRVAFVGIAIPTVVTLTVWRAAYEEPQPPAPSVLPTYGRIVIPPFTPSWVQNHRITEMWSGAAGTEDVVSFGATSAQFCYFLVIQPQESSRLHVWNPLSQNTLWLDAHALGAVPAGPSEIPDPAPDDQNCWRGE